MLDMGESLAGTAINLMLRLIQHCGITYIWKPILTVNQFFVCYVATPIQDQPKYVPRSERQGLWFMAGMIGDAIAQTVLPVATSILRWKTRR